MKVLLGSKSPRRHQLLKELNIDFKVVVIDCDETYPADMNAFEVAVHLAEKKNNAFDGLKTDELLLTADTTVVLDNTILHKPKNREEAIGRLKEISGRSHHVVTGVCLRTLNERYSFSEITEVIFNEIPMEDAAYYVNTIRPYDKAGGYGIQDWIGKKFMQSIEGSYTNVMGLPIESLRKILEMKFNLLVS